MTPFTWRGVDGLIVAPIREGRCEGCLFDGPNECPHTDKEPDIICDGAVNDNICIEDTPEAIAEYMAERLA